MTDNQLLIRMKRRSLLWTEHVETGVVLCCMLDDQYQTIQVDPNQAQRLYNAGLIKELPGIVDSECSGQYHLSSDGWTRLFDLPRDERFALEHF